MQPATIHLLAQLIRHGRGICTAIDKWATAQPPSATTREIREATAAWRGVFELCEEQLSQADRVPPVQTMSA